MGELHTADAARRAGACRETLPSVGEGGPGAAPGATGAALERTGKAAAAA